MGSNNFESLSCPNCGVRVKSSARYCKNCGKRVNHTQLRSTPVQYSVEENFTRYTIHKKPYWLLLGSIYTIRDTNAQELMTIKGGFRPLVLVSVIILLFLCLWGVFEPVIFILLIILIIAGIIAWESIFGEHLYVFSLIDATGSSVGKIGSNWKRSKWNILDSSEKKIGNITLSDKYGGKMKTTSNSFTIKTALKPKTLRSQVLQKFEVYDSNNDLLFSLIGKKQFIYETSELKLMLNKAIPLFLPCSLAICLSERYWVDWKLIRIEEPFFPSIEEELQFKEDFPVFSKDVPKKVTEEQLELPLIKSTIEKEIIIPSVSEIKSYDEMKIDPSIGLEVSVQEEIEDQEPLITTDTEIVTETIDLPIKTLNEDKRSLFSSIQYQVQDMIFESSDTGPIVQIIPYSGSIKQVTVEFDQNQIIMRGCLNRPLLPQVSFELKIEGLSSQPSWDNPWQDIRLYGEEIILDRIRTKRGIAEKLNSLGTASAKVESHKQGEICIYITCIERQDVIEIAYSLMKDFQSFCEILLY